MTQARDPWAGFIEVSPPPPRDPWAEFIQVEQPARRPLSAWDVAGMFLGTAGRMADQGVRAVARGATLGAMDEIAAAGNATLGTLTGAPGTWRERYLAALEAERQRDADFDARNPVVSAGLQIAGGVASPVNRLIPNPAATTLPRSVLRGAGIGAGVGAGAGFLSGEGGLEGRLPAATTAAALGASVGAAVPLVIAGGGTAYNALRRHVVPGAQREEAQRILLRDLARDNVTPQEVARAAREAGDVPVALVDLAGPNVQGLGQVVARAPGEGQTLARRLLEQRAGVQQADRLRATIRNAISEEDFSATLQAVAQRRREIAAPLYEEAYSVVLPRDLRLQRFLNDPDIRQGIRAGIDSARREALALDRAFDLADYGIRLGRNGDIQIVGGGTPTRLFDAAKRGLDQLEEAARGPNGQATARSREIAELRRSMLAEIDRLNPAYARAREAYAGDSALLDAARAGRELVTLRPEQFERSIADIRAMSPSEREFFRMGVARGLIDRINATADGAEATRLRQVFGTPFMRERLAATFDDPAEFERFSRIMEQELRIASTNRAIDPRGGSPTMPMQERRADIAAPPRNPISEPFVAAPGQGFDLARVARPLMGLGGPDYATINLADQLAQMAGRSRFERNTAELARMLFNPAPVERTALAEELVRRALADARTANRSALVSGALLRGGVVGTTDASR